MNKNSGPYLPYGRQNITEADIKAVNDVLRSPLLTQGPVVPTFEKAIAKKVGAKYGVAVNSATSALHIACLALGLGPGDRLWTSPITFVASANCGRYCGAEVDFVDIDPMTGLMSVKALEDKLQKAEKEGKLPKIVVPVHLTGSSCDVAEMERLSELYGFKLLEDASHAIGGMYQGKPVGSCKSSAITVFSFHPVKIITSGEGGLATTNDPHLAQCMEELRSHGIVRETERFIQQPVGPWIYEQQQLGFNYRMTEIHAALGLSQLDRLDEIVAKRNIQLNLYNELLQDLPVKLLKIPEDVLSSVHLAVVRIENSKPETHRKVFEYLRAAGIGVQVHYSPVHLQPYYRKHGFDDGQFPEAEAYGYSAISIPLYPQLKETDQSRTVSELTNALKENGLMG